MRNHIVNTGNYKHHFKEVESMFDTPFGGVQLSGIADNITDFVLSIDIEKQWIPYGYGLYFVVRQKGSKNMTAFLYQTPKK